MKQNKLSQKEFISLFPNTRFRYIHDVNKNDTVQGNGTLDMSWNKKGYGIFFTVNGFPPIGKADEAHLLSLNANYVDFDVDPKLSQEEKEKLIQEAIMSGLEAGIPTPTVINRTQKGAHLIWLYPGTMEPMPENILKWRDIQKRLVHFYKGDTNCTDPSRVLRVPYTMHLKDPANPFEIKIMSYKPEARCTIDELDEAVPKYSNSEINSDKTPAMKLLLEGVPVGENLRHGALAQIAGLLLMGANTPEKVAIARENYYNWDQKIVGSPEGHEERKKELDDTFEGILERKIAGDKTGSFEKFAFVKPPLWTMGEILDHDFGEEEWIVESIIPKQGVAAISGTPGHFKTWLTIHMALCITRGTLVFDKFMVSQGSVLIIDEEDNLRLLKRRLGFLGAKETDNIHYLSQSGIKIDVKEIRDMILEIVKEKNIKLVILDSLIRVHNQEENDAGGMAKVFRCLQEITQAGASILFTHHHRKQQGFGSSDPGQSMRGSSDILAAVDCHITTEKKRDEEDLLVIRQTKLRQDEELKPFEVKILREAVDEKGKKCPSGFEYAGDYDDKKEKAEEAAAAVVILLTDGMMSRLEIHEGLHGEFGKTAIDDGIKIAEGKGDIVRVPKEELTKEQRKKYYYRIPPKVLFNIPGTDSYDEVQNDLPVSQLYIGAGKQEDECSTEELSF